MFSLRCVSQVYINKLEKISSLRVYLEEKTSECNSRALSLVKTKTKKVASIPAIHDNTKPKQSMFLKPVSEMQMHRLR